MAVVISLAFCKMLVLPSFNQLTGKEIHIPFNQSSFWLSILVCCLSPDLFPAVTLHCICHAFKPVRVLKGTLKFSTTALWFRKGLGCFSIYAFHRTHYWDHRCEQTGKLHSNC